MLSFESRIDGKNVFVGKWRRRVVPPVYEEGNARSPRSVSRDNVVELLREGNI